MDKGRVHLIIKGWVQGVFFRASIRDMAQGLGLTGWVRNLSDGSVDVVFEGQRDLLREAVRWCHKGPSGAMVKEVEENWLEYTGEFEGFEIRYGRI